MAKRRVTTHSKVASAPCTHVCVCVCACTQACAPRRPSSERSYVGCQGCVFCFVFCFGESPPPCCGSVAGSSGSSPPVLRQCRWRKGRGFPGGEEREEKGGLLSAWVCHGHVGGCLHAHADSYKHTDVATVTTIPVHTRLPARSKWNPLF